MNAPARYGQEGDLQACRALLRDGSRTFYAASHLLPARVRDPAIALYAFCRVADDAVDLASESDPREASDPTSTHTAAERALARLHHRLDRVYAGSPLPQPADRAFADVVERFAIPRTLPLALLEGFEWDTQGRQYASMEALHGYAVRVAGTVGVMMALLMDVRNPQALARACDLGIGMQLTNIARDVGEDARAGRLYLPLEWLEAEGIDPVQWLADPQPDERIARVVERVLVAADNAYARARDGIAALPVDCRSGIDAAGRLYSEIGEQVRRNGLDSVSRRAVVRGRRKLWVTLPALFAVAKASGGSAAKPAIQAAQFLINAVISEPLVPRRPVGNLPPAGVRLAGGRLWRWIVSIDDSLGRVLEMLERLEREEQAGLRGVSRT